METANDRRKRKLTSLVGQHGLDEISRRSGVNAASLDQILKGVLLPKKADGTRSPRSLGDRAARRIEEAFQLGLGWFDAPEPGEAQRSVPFRDLNVFEGQLLGFFRQLPPDQQHAIVVALNKMVVTGAATEADPFANSLEPRGMSIFGDLDEGQEKTG